MSQSLTNWLSHEWKKNDVSARHWFFMVCCFCCGCYAALLWLQMTDTLIIYHNAFSYLGRDPWALHEDNLRREPPSALLVYSNLLFQSGISADDHIIFLEPSSAPIIPLFQSLQWLLKYKIRNSSPCQYLLSYTSVHFPLCTMFYPSNIFISPYSGG